MSSDKSLPDGRNYPEHVDANPNPSEAIIDDDIEKRVVINEDGSLSMEMKVRFRLLNDETLQWSTQVTKNGGPKSCEYLQGHSHYFQQSSLESYSELECVVSACEEQEAYIAKRYQRHMEEAHCTHCCDQCQEYHNWTNQPIPQAQEGSRHITSSSSTASSHTMVCRKTKVKNTSLSSEEGGGQVVETETWMENAVDTVNTIDYCTIKSDVSPQRFKGRSSVVKGVDRAEEIPERLTLVPSQSGQMCGPLSLVSLREERAGSAISASSLILASLTEDRDNEEDDLPTGVSRSDLCTRNVCPSPQSRGSSSSAHSGMSKKTLKSSTPSEDRRNVEMSSPLSTTSKSPKTKCTCVTTKASGSNSPMSTISAGEILEAGEIERQQSSAMSVKSNSSVTSGVIANNEGGDPEYPESAMLVQDSTEEVQQMDEVLDEGESTEMAGEDRVPSSMSYRSRSNTSSRPSKASELPPEPSDDANRPSSNLSQRSGASTDHDDTVERTASAMSGKSVQSNSSTDNKPNVSENPSVDGADNHDEETAEGSEDERVSSAMSSKSVKSIKSHVSATSIKSKSSEHQAEISSNEHKEPETRAPSKLSVKSTKSAKSDSGDISDDGTPKEVSPDRATSAMSTKSARSCTSARSSKSKRSHHSLEGDDERSHAENAAGEEKERTQSAMSATSNASGISRTSKTSAVPSERDILVERPASTISTKSVKSNSSAIFSIDATAEENLELPEDGNAEGENAEDVKEERATSCMSMESTQSAKSNVSALSKKSKVSESPAADSGDISAKDTAVEEPEESENRAASSMSTKSGKSNVSARLTTSKCSEVPSDKSVEIPDEINPEEEAEGSLFSVSSAKSHVSRRSRTSRTPVASSQEDTEGDEGNVERPASSMSGKSVQSHASEISNKSKACESKERSQSVLSAKSTKSNISATSRTSRKSAAAQSEENTVDDNNMEARAPSAMSLKSTKSDLSSRSKKLKSSDITDEKGDFEEMEPEMRAPSNMSSKSTKSAKSNASAISNTSRDYGDCTVNSGDIPDHRTTVEETTERATSAMSAVSVRSNISARSSLLEVPSVNGDMPDRGHGEEGIEGRVPSVMSTKSNTSRTSRSSKVSGRKAEVETGERAARSISAKSTGSKANVTEGPAAPIDILHISENETDERGPSSMSATSKSNLSVRSTKSVKSIASAASNKSNNSEHPVEHGDDIHIEGPAEEETVDRAGQAADKTAKRPQSSMSAKSAKSNLSVKSGTSMASKVTSERSERCIADEGPTEEEHVIRVVSAQSNKSVKSNISKRSSTSKVSGETPERFILLDAEDQERPTSAQSVKSTTSTVSKKSKVSQCPAKDSDDVDKILTEDETDKGRAQSPVKSDVSVKSSTIPFVNIDDAEARPTSEKSNISARTKGSTASNDALIHTVQDQKRPKSSLSVESNLSARSRKSKTSEVHSDKHSECSDKSDVGDNEMEMSKQELNDSSSGKTSISVRSNRSRVAEIPKRTSATAVSIKSSRSKGDAVGTGGSHNPNDGGSHVDENCYDKTEAMSKSVRSSRCLKNATAEDTTKSIAVTKLGASDTPASKTTSDSDLSQSLPSPDIVDEKSDNIYQADSPSNSNVTNRTNNHDHKSDTSSKCRHRVGTSPSQQKREDLVPSRLPNASSIEVVSEWLKNIPADNTMYDNVDEFERNCEGHEHEHGELTEGISKTGEVDNTQKSAAEDEEKPQKASGVLVNSVPESSDQTNTSKAENTCNCDRTNYTSKVFHSSVQVMKVLLSPKIDRCNSLPEISPVYGRKLSTSAQGLLDCLVKLQLIEFSSANETTKDQKYSELMNILQSLWLCEPSQSKQIVKHNGQPSLDEDLNRTSSSGVDVNSGSTGSGQSSLNSGVQTNGNVEVDTLMKVQEVNEAEEEASVESTAMVSNEPSQNIHRDTQFTPDKQMGQTDIDQKEDEPGSNETISIDSPRELPGTPQSSGNTNSSGNDSSKAEKLPEVVGRDCQEDNTSSIVERAQLTKNVSQDPIWLLNLLNKLQKQFMKHYVNAMTEFKVRWNLDDNEEVDSMISELKCQVRKRIQASIDRELRKIQVQAHKIDFDSKRILNFNKSDTANAQTIMPTVNIEHAEETVEETKAAEMLVEHVIIDAVKEVKCNRQKEPAEETFEKDKVEEIKAEDETAEEENSEEENAEEIMVEEQPAEEQPSEKHIAENETVEETSEKDNDDEIMAEETAEEEMTEQDVAEEIMAEDGSALEKTSKKDSTEEIMEDETTKEDMSEKDHGDEIIAEDESAEVEMPEKNNADEIIDKNETSERDPVEEEESAEEEMLEKDNTEKAMVENETVEEETADQDTTKEVLDEDETAREEETLEKDNAEDETAEAELSEKEIDETMVEGETTKEENADQDLAEEILADDENAEENDNTEDEIAETEMSEKENGEENETGEAESSEKDPAEEIIAEGETVEAEMSEKENAHDETAEEETSQHDHAEEMIAEDENRSSRHVWGG